MKIITMYVWLLLELINWSQAFAVNNGGWDGGGGRIIKYEQNPWWVENTVHVDYCIEVDEQHFGVEKEVLSLAVKNSLNKWKKALEAYAYTGPDSTLIGTQDFSEVDKCNPEIQLRFQFGVLTDFQKSHYFDDPRNYVARAVRTNYDLVNLRSRGFVYVAPMNGELRPRSRYIADDAWTRLDGDILRMVIEHELGHVFGADHGNGIMEERVPSWIVNEKFIQIYEEFPPDVRKLALRTFEIDSLFGPKKVFRKSGCDNKKPFVSDIFNIDSTISCLEIKLHETKYSGYELQISGGETLDSLEKIGGMASSGRGERTRSFITVLLPPEQGVFELSEDDNDVFNTRYGPYVVEEVDANGIYSSETTSVPLFIRLRAATNYDDFESLSFRDGQFVRGLLDFFE